ncbi:MAG: hypothetical protein K5894_14045, partial [Lachnospiraceae bacterium]|nr:hypothetical protein [Lachnospiraceae bacterium]
MNKIKDFFAAGYDSTRQYFVNNLKFVSLISIPAIIYTVYLLSKMLGHTFTDVNIPNEYREAANVLLTSEFLKGNNIYSIEALNSDLPPMIYLYGPLYSLVTAFFGIFIKTDIVLLHYFVTFACIVGSAFLA